MMLYKLLKFLGLRKDKDTRVREPKPFKDEFDDDIRMEMHEERYKPWWEEDSFGLTQHEKIKYYKEDELRKKDKMYGDLLQHIPRPYPKWKKMVPELPTTEQFEQAWKNAYGHPFEKCSFEFTQFGASITTPTNSIADGSFHKEYTDEPNVDSRKEYYYDGCGCTWTTDNDGKPYLLLSKSKNMPWGWDIDVRNKLIILNYFKNNKQINRKEKLDKLFCVGLVEN